MLKGIGKGSHDLLFKFLDPSISREQLKLETSNMIQILTTQSHYRKKCKIRSKGGHEGVICPTFQILGPLSIYGTVEARNFKFGTHIEPREELTKKIQN